MVFVLLARSSISSRLVLSCDNATLLLLFIWFTYLHLFSICVYMCVLVHVGLCQLVCAGAFACVSMPAVFLHLIF